MTSVSRRFILKDDKTDRSGVVLDGIAGSSFEGAPTGLSRRPGLLQHRQQGDPDDT